ncbi:hypothetical protein [Streptantibioticus cattleyicolor]|uniref:hypothetical protein n=1 Tax=Streptantibioticus cattleyicolor TaxID=29303 RepID=UPI000213F05F|nr:hypothetical protein [Streptantibioticus cattleyicolor]CCB71388.1 exported protein of unknown function [Streptantibioticus cattleyicolor NRRL 8057 = DSM 46488]
MLVRSLLATVTTVALAACGMAVATGTADAATTTASATTFTVPAGVTHATVSLGTAHATVTRSPATAQTGVTCTLTVNTPIHTSTIVYGSASIGCTAPVSQLTMSANLYKNGALAVAGDLMETWSSGSLSANAYTPYAPGTYQTGAQGTVTYPAGYTPPTGTMPLTYSPKALL